MFESGPTLDMTRPPAAVGGQPFPIPVCRPLPLARGETGQRPEEEVAR